MTLLEEIAQDESASLEFKEFRPKDSLKFTKTVVAFANGRGGVARYYTAMAKADLKPPVAEEQDEVFKVVFWRPQITSKTIGTAARTTADTASRTKSRTERTEGGVEKNLSKLKLAGVIRRIGPNKGGHWEVVARPAHA